MDVVPAEALPAVQERQLDDEEDAGYCPAQALDELEIGRAHV